MQLVLFFTALGVVFYALIMTFGVLGAVSLFTFWFFAKTFLNYREAQRAKRREYVRSQMLRALGTGR